MLTRDSAEVVALQALGWLAGEEELLGIFMGASGSSGEDLQQGAQTPEFLAAVLEFITMDDAWVIQFCDACGLSYEAPMQALTALPGGEPINWT